MWAGYTVRVTGSVKRKNLIFKNKKQKTFIKLITSWIVASEFYFSRNFQWHIKVLHFQFYYPIKIYSLAYQKNIYIYIFLRKILLLHGTRHIKRDTFTKIDKHCIHFAKVYNICHFLSRNFFFGKKEFALTRTKGDWEDQWWSCYNTSQLCPSLRTPIDPHADHDTK